MKLIERRAVLKLSQVFQSISAYIHLMVIIIIIIKLLNSNLVLLLVAYYNCLSQFCLAQCILTLV